MIQTLTQPKSVLDFQRMPEGSPLQLISGEFIMSPSPLFAHQKILLYLAKRLDDFVIQGELGEVCAAPFDVYLSDRDVYQPDIFFVSKANRSRIRDNGCYGAPDLVVEILSPSTAYYDLHQKKEVYQKHGVREYWIVNPMDGSIEIFGNEKAGFRTHHIGKSGKACSQILPQFCIEIGSLFSLYK